MSNVNINAGAVGNPIDALIAQHGGSLYGSSGFNIENALAQSRAGTIDPRIQAMGYGKTPYDDTYQFNPSDPNIDSASGRINLNGQQYIQLANTSIGGQGQPIDPNQVQYNAQYGAITPYSNIKPISTGYGDAVFALAALGLGLPTAYAAMGGVGGAAGEAAGGSTPIDVSTSDLGGLGTVGGQGAPVSWSSGGVAGAADTTGATGTSAGFSLPSLSNVGSMVSNPLVRGAAGMLAGAMGGGSSPGRGGGTSGGSGNGLDIGGLINTGLGYGLDQNLINQFQSQFNDLYNKGDYNAQNRPGQLNQLNNFLMNPTAALQDPGYQAMRQQQLDNESRTLAARGFNMSGNEEGDLMKYGTNLDYQHLNDTENQLRQAASLGNPDQMARAGMTSLPFMYGMMSNRNNDLTSGLNRGGVGNFVNGLLGGNGKGTGNIVDTISSWLGGSGNTPNAGLPSTTDPSSWYNGDVGNGGYIDDPGWVDQTGGTADTSWMNDIFGP